MIDTTLTLTGMLANIQWPREADRVTFDDLRDDNVYSLGACHVSMRCIASEYDFTSALSDLYLRKFHWIPFDEMYNGLVRPVRSAMHDRIGRHHHANGAATVIFEHYSASKGIVISITDESDSVDEKGSFGFVDGNLTDSLDKNEVLRKFCKCGSVISCANDGRTLLIQHRFDRKIVGNNGKDHDLAGSVMTKADILEALPTTRNPYKLLSRLGRHGPRFLRCFWATPEFTAKYVYGQLGECGRERVRPESCSATLVRIRGGAVTVQYVIDGGKIFAKFYRDEHRGDHSYRVLRALWDAGFHKGEAHLVPQPISYVRDQRLLLTGGGDGIDIERLCGGDDLLRACRMAAQWLVKLHGVSVRLGRDGRADDYLGYAEMVVRDAVEGSGENRSYAVVLDDLMKKLRHRARVAREKGSVLVQTHGDLKPQHVFVSGDGTTVVDFDNSAPADPAVDIARFVWWVRRQLFEATGELTRAEMATRAFLDEYALSLPGSLGNLAFYLGCEILWSLAGSGDDASAAFESYVDFHVREFEGSAGISQDIQFGT